MALTNYGELKTAIADTLNKSNLTAQIPDFISLAERRMFYGFYANPTDPASYVEGLRCRENEKAANWTGVNIQPITIPADLLEVKLMTVNGTEVFRKSDQFIRTALGRNNTNAGSGVPEYFGRLADSYYFHPVPDSQYDVTLDYYADLSGSLTADSDDNAVLLADPGVYLYGACMEAAPWLKDDGRISLWTSKFINCLASLNRATNDESVSGSSYLTDVVHSPYQEW